MRTSSFETAFVQALKRHIETSHSDLQLTIPSAGTYADDANAYFTPDAVVKNRRTGEVLIIEIKGGRSSNTVPFAFFSRIKAAKHQHQLANRPVNMVLVSNIEIPKSMKALLEEEDIDLAHAETVQGAITALEGTLARLDAR